MPRSIRRVTRRTHVTAAHGGLFRAMADPAAVVRAGTPIGRIHDMAGRTLEEVVFDQDTIVIGVRTDPVVHSGDRVAFVALDWDDVDVDG
jgi:predicted deacylase